MKKTASVAMFIATLAGASAAQAAPVTFFGEDLGQGEHVRLASHVNADNAKASFYANLTGVGTEDFESMSGNVADFGYATATLSSGTLKELNSLGTNGVGRYPISGTHYYEATSSFTLSFSQSISAFGFYGVDIGDFDGQVILHMVGGGTVDLNIGNSTNTSGGGVLYFGFYDLLNNYDSITFTNTAAGTDYFAFDDFTIGTLSQVDPVDPVPEPATMLLFGTGLAGLAAVGRRKNNK